MSERELILATLSPGTVHSRTMLQKLAYLLGVLEHEPVAYAPHFYGPYSATVQRELERLVAAGLVDERVRVYEAWEPGEFDMVAYEYDLTEAGRVAVEQLPERLGQAAEDLVQKVKSLGAWNQAALSMAAKLHHLRTIDANIPDDSVSELARQFGWRMTPRDAALGAEVLRALSLVPSA